MVRNIAFQTYFSPPGQRSVVCQYFAWHPDGNRLVTGGGDVTVGLWQADGTSGPVLQGHNGGVWSVAWSPDGKRIASTGWDFTPRTWDAQTGKPQWFSVLLPYGRSATISADGRLIDGSEAVNDQHFRYFLESVSGSIEVLKPAGLLTQSAGGVTLESRLQNMRESSWNRGS